jgi:exonuclease III
MNVANEDHDVYSTKNKDGHPGFAPAERESFKSLLDRGFVDTFR